MKHTKCYIKDYPRPQLTRTAWQNLNGEWDFIYLPEELKEGLKEGFTTKKKINVPFTYETKLSGINVQEAYDEIWYSRKVNLTKEQLTDSVLLHFEGCDYFTTVFVNGKQIGQNEGAYHRFSFDIRSALKEGENVIVVKVEDSLSYYLPRGKQRWHKESYECFYVQTTGIWKTVWLEFLNENYIKHVKMTPDISDNSVYFEVETAIPDEEVDCEITVSFNGQFIRRASVSCAEESNGVKVSVVAEHSQPSVHLWYPFAPYLYDVEFRLLKKGKEIDKAGSYFGLREVKTEGNKILQNTLPAYLKLVLDQGYYKDSGMTPPNEEALVQDIELAQKMGFNGARKHEKIEDERYFYYADVLGFIVWCEMPSAYGFSDAMIGRMEREWHNIVCQHYNHPSIFTWVVLNESWGVNAIAQNKNMQMLANTLYYQTKAIDPVRPVVTNDGWEHTISDILTLHHYEQNPKEFSMLYDSLEKLTEGTWHKRPYAEGYSYGGQPIIMSEYGGTAYIKEAQGDNWGYGVGCKDEQELAERFEGLYQAIKAMPSVVGLCYTQLTDVEQEVNGLLDMERKPKINLDTIREILSK